MRRIWSGLLLVLLLTACGAEQSAPAEPAVEPDVPPVVQTEEAVATYWDEPLEALAADDGYGALVPYVGREVRPDTEEDTTDWDLYWYGLATTDGRVVTEPVYATVEQLWYDTPDGGNGRLPVYALWTEKFWENDTRLCAVAAQDGSWCTEQVYLWAGAVGPDRVVLMDQAYRLWFCDLEGNVTPTAVDHPITDLWDIMFPNSVDLFTVAALRSAPDEQGGWFVNLETGDEVYFPSGTGFSWNRQGDLLAIQVEDGYGYIDETGGWVLEPEFAWADDFYGSYGLVWRTPGGPSELINADGETVLFAGGDVSACLVDGDVYWVAADEEGSVAEIRDQNLQPVDLPAVGGRYMYAQNALSWEDEDGGRWFWDGSAVYAYPDDTLTLESWAAGRALFSRMPETGTKWYGLYDPEEGRWILDLSPDHCYLFTVNGDTYLGMGNGNPVYDLDGNRICGGDWIGTPVDGVFPVVDGDWTGLVDQSGQWLLRMPMDGLSS